MSLPRPFLDGVMMIPGVNGAHTSDLTPSRNYGGGAQHVRALADTVQRFLIEKLFGTGCKKYRV